MNAAMLVESLTDYAVFMIDLSGTVVSWNPGVKRVLGYDAGEFVGLPFVNLFTPEDIARNRPAQELERALATGQSEDKRHHVRQDGKDPVQVQAVRLHQPVREQMQPQVRIGNVDRRCVQVDLGPDHALPDPAMRVAAL